MAATFTELYNAGVSLALISKVTDAVMEQVVERQNRPLDAVYPIVSLDCIVLKVRQDSRIINKLVFLALGINIEGQKEQPGMWLAENEGTKFWLNVLTELKNCGLNDILITCVDSLKGFPDAVNMVYPEARIQLCIVYMVRNSLHFVSWKGYKVITRDLKRQISAKCSTPRTLSWLLNSVILHAIRKHKVFPTDDPVKKVVWLAILSASQKWTPSLKDWRQ